MATTSGLRAKLGPLLGLALGHHLVVEEALPDLVRAPRGDRLAIARRRREPPPARSLGIGAQASGHAGGGGATQVGGQHLVEHERAEVELALVERVDEELGLVRAAPPRAW